MRGEVEAERLPENGRSSKNRLDMPMTVVKPLGWMALTAAGIMLAAFVFWGIEGEIPAKIPAQGILIKSGGVYNVSHTSSGKITDVRVSAGDEVKPGEVIAIIEQNELVKEITDLKKELEEKRNLLNLMDSSAEYEIQDMELRLAELKEELIYASSVVSPYNGRVLELKANKGDILEKGKPVVGIELSGKEFKDLEAILYIAAEEGSQVRPGMEVEIEPNSAKKEEYGYMAAKVIAVSEYPVTNQGLMRFLGNEELVNQFLGHGALLEIRAELTTKSDNVSGYKWTSSKGPNCKISSGTLCRGEITVSKEMPLKLILSGESGGGGGH